MSTSAIIGLLAFVFLMILVLNRIPVFAALLATAFLGFVVLNGGDMTAAITQFTKAPFTISANFNMAVVPMFILVGTLAELTGIAEGAFQAVRAWLGRVKGGMLFTVIGANAVFGACSGISSAGTIVFSRMALPELKKSGYDESLSLGCITSAGSLASLIPPSMSILVFCLVAPQPITYLGKSMTLSVGTALTCGIVPGLLTAVLLCVTVRIVGALKKGTIPPASEEKVSWNTRLKSLRLLIPILCLFGIIIGGCMFGFFSATVGGAIGAFAVCLYAIAKRIPPRKILYAIWDAAVMEGAMFLIMLGGQMFSRFMAASRLADELSRLLNQVNTSKWGIFLIVVTFYMLAGCIMNIMPLIIITVPVVFPLLTSVGYHPYAIIIMLILMAEIGTLTPPIGMNVYMVANAIRKSPTIIFKGVVPFFLCEFVVALLIGLFPQIVTCLPAVLGLI